MAAREAVPKTIDSSRGAGTRSPLNSQGEGLKLTASEIDGGPQLKEETWSNTNRLYDWGRLLLCNMIWGSQFVVWKIVQRQAGPVFAALFPITIATLLLIPVLQPGAPQDSQSR